MRKLGVTSRSSLVSSIAGGAAMVGGAIKRLFCRRGRAADGGWTPRNERQQPPDPPGCGNAVVGQQTFTASGFAQGPSDSGVEHLFLADGRINDAYLLQAGQDALRGVVEEGRERVVYRNGQVTVLKPTHPGYWEGVDVTTPGIGVAGGPPGGCDRVDLGW